MLLKKELAVYRDSHRKKAATFCVVGLSAASAFILALSGMHPLRVAFWPIVLLQIVALLATIGAIFKKINHRIIIVTGWALASVPIGDTLHNTPVVCVLFGVLGLAVSSMSSRYAKLMLSYFIMSPICTISIAGYHRLYPETANPAYDMCRQAVGSWAGIGVVVIVFPVVLNLCLRVISGGGDGDRSNSVRHE